MAIVKVSEAAKELGVRPQIIHAILRDDANAHLIKQENPRSVDLDEIQQFLVNRDKQPRVRKQTESLGDDDDEQPTGGFTGVGDLVTWNRRNGRGWALAKIDEESQPVENLIVLATHDRGEHYATVNQLTKELEEASIYFLAPEQAVALIAGQLGGLLNAQEAPDTHLASAKQHLINAIQELKQYKGEMHAPSNSQ